MKKDQKAVLMKAFRILRTGAAEGEKIANEGNVEQVAEHINVMMRLLYEMREGLDMHVCAKAVLETVETNRPASKAPIGRPRSGLKLVK